MNDTMLYNQMSTDNNHIVELLPLIDSPTQGQTTQGQTTQGQTTQGQTTKGQTTLGQTTKDQKRDKG